MVAAADAVGVVVLAGATGLVGRECLRLLSADEAVTQVKVLVRRPLPQRPAAKVLECKTDFDRIEAHAGSLAGDAVLCALGTTIRKAGSQEAFRRVDFDYPLAIAKAARSGGARHFLLVSAMGANARSSVFYNRVKGELEEAVLALGYPSLTIARPSLLLGEREERRPGEELGRKLGWLVPARWRPVHASQVAAALVRAAHRKAPGTQILDNPALRAA